MSRPFLAAIALLLSGCPNSREAANERFIDSWVEQREAYARDNPEEPQPPVKQDWPERNDAELFLHQYRADTLARALGIAADAEPDQADQDKENEEAGRRRWAR